jgi:hypothetical protein
LDPETVLWWLGQSNEARNQVIDATGRMEDALNAFAAWVQEQPVAGFWGNGAGFDNVILKEAYRRQGLQLPWRFDQDRCYRTVKARSNVELRRRGTHHHALDDALSQANHLIDIWADSALSASN